MPFMKLQLTKPIVFFDLETTGLNIVTDRIVEISLLKIFPDAREEKMYFLINPEISIPPKSTEIHGVSDADVEKSPVFKTVGKQIALFLKDCDIAGYNSNKFDIPLLAEEFVRAEIDFDWSKSKFVDVHVLYLKKEPRTLSAAYKYYCNKELENAHSAEADTYATYEVLKSQLAKYTDLENNIQFLSEYTAQNKNVDFAGRIIFNDKNVEVFNFGKYKGQAVEEIFQKDPGYYSWMMKGEFHSHTKQVITKIKLRGFSS